MTGRIAAAARLAAFTAAVLALATACDDDDEDTLGPNVASAVTLTAGTNNQQARFATAVTESLEVKVTNSRGNPVTGATVTWAVTAAGGSVNPTTSQTNAQGIARTRFTLGPVAGNNTVTATVAGVSTPATFTATGQAETFSATLNSANEIPTGSNPQPVSPATATAALQYNGQSLSWTVNIANNLTTDPTGLHIHSPASTTQNAGIAANLGFTALTRTGLISSGTLTAPSNANFSLDSLLKDMRAGRTYVNIHTTQYTGGELRGQIRQP